MILATFAFGFHHISALAVRATNEPAKLSFFICASSHPVSLSLQHILTTLSLPMSKFSRLAQAGTGSAPYPGASAPPPGARPPQSPWSPDSIAGYPQGPAVPPRPSASPQPGYQQFQQPPQQTYGSPQLGVPQQGYGQPGYGQPQGYNSHPGYPPSPQPSNSRPSSAQQPPYSSYGSQYQQPGRPPPQGGQHSPYPGQQQQYPPQGYVRFTPCALFF